MENPPRKNEITAIHRKSLGPRTETLSMEFHHAGIAAEDGPTTTALFADLLDADVVHEESLDGLNVAFLAVGGSEGVGVDADLLEILEPTGDGPVARFLEREGPGIHHLAFATEDLPAAIERARSLGIEPIDDEPRAGAAGHEVAFLHPSDTAGVLVEFVEH